MLKTLEFLHNFAVFVIRAFIASFPTIWHSFRF